MDAPLKGIRVIDWTIWQQGPVATAMLADMGAEVIKIEEREKGDPGRGVFAIGGAESTRNFYFEANNRHKQSLTLDLSKPGAWSPIVISAAVPTAISATAAVMARRLK